MEWWIDGLMEYWGVGVLGDGGWSNGVLEWWISEDNKKIITLLLHYSNISLLLLRFCDARIKSKEGQ